MKYQNETLTNDDKKSIEQDAKMLVKDLVYILNETKFNNQHVFSSNDKTIQVGANRTDTATISGTRFGVVGKVDHFEEVKYSIKDYDLSVRTSDGLKLIGNLKVNEKKSVNTHAFELINGEKSYQGTLKFLDNEKGIFRLHANGLYLEGEVDLNEESSKKTFERN